MDAGPGSSRLEEVWNAQRGPALALARGMLRDPAEAEDVVQEAFDRLTRIDLDEVQDVRAWLAVVVRRRCLDRIKSARARREVPHGDAEVGAGSALHGGSAPDPADRATLDDEVQRALALVLDRLTPAERTAFLLHDVFGFGFPEVAEIVGRTPAACRQLASRARRSIGQDAPRGLPRPAAAHALVVERFVAACTGGDLGELIAVLDPDVAGVAVLLGHGPIVTATGRIDVASRLLSIFGPDSGRSLLPVPLEGAPGLVAVERGVVVAVVRLEVVDGRVHHIDSYVQPPSSRRGATRASG
jgi:RNA polymerase sigma-70 factor (ECF subfamily)